MKLLHGLVAMTFLALTGCASVSVKPGEETSVQSKPKRIYVEQFGTSKGEFNVDREGAELVEFKKDLQRMMQTGITVYTTDKLLPAQPAKARQHFDPQHAWLIRGDFTRVNQGSRLLRGSIGFGLGATKLETHVRVYDLSKGDASAPPFLTFSTTGGSNAEPGAIASMSLDPVLLAIGLVSGGAGNIVHGITEDTARTSREINATLSDYMYRHHWIDDDQWTKPKLKSKDLPALSHKG